MMTVCNTIEPTPPSEGNEVLKKVPAEGITPRSCKVAVSNIVSLFSFFINGVAPLSLNVQQVDLLAPWGGFCFFPPLGGCLWMKTGTEEEEDKRERGRRGRGVSQKKKKSEACSDVFQSQLQKGWALVVSLEGRRLS